MKKLCFINGSPRGKNSCSQGFINEISKILKDKDFDIAVICAVESLRSGTTEAVFEKICNSDSIIITFPLYVDCLPSHLLEFMVGFEEFLQKNQNYRAVIEKNKPTLHAIANCGFIEGNQNRHALKIVENFAKKTGLQWKFGIGVGGGEFMRATENSIPMESGMKSKIYGAFKLLAKDIEGSDTDKRENILIEPPIPRPLFILTANRYWITEANKNSVTKKQLYSRTAF